MHLFSILLIEQRLLVFILILHYLFDEAIRLIDRRVAMSAAIGWREPAKEPGIELWGQRLTARHTGVTAAGLC